MARRSLEEVIEGYYVGSAVHVLQVSGALNRLAGGLRARDLAEAIGWEPMITAAVLELVGSTSTVVRRSRDGRFHLGDEVQRAAGRALLEKLVGAYGEPVRQLRSVLSEPGRGRALVDGAALATAFGAEESIPALVIRLVHAFASRTVLDLGCGTGLLLSRVCRGNSLRGLGIDASAHMCRLARARLRSDGLSRRVSVRMGRAEDCRKLLSPAELDSIDVVHGSSLLNEYWREQDGCVRILRRLSRAFPGRMLINVDYLGVLTRVYPAPPRKRPTVLHDFAQVISGQGVPPATPAGWKEAYRRAGAHLRFEAYSRNQALRWFVHAIELGDR